MRAALSVTSRVSGSSDAAAADRLMPYAEASESAARIDA